MKRRLPLPVLPLVLRVLGVVIIAGLIFYWSIWTIPPETPADPHAPDFLPLHQWRHIVAYFALGVSIAYTLVTSDRSWRQKATMVVIAAAGYGLLIEIGQAFQPQRSFDAVDILINSIGAALSATWYAVERGAELVHVPEEFDHLLPLRD